jgi:PAS domain S-box-containing protein
MKDERKSKEELIRELRSLRRKVSRLEKLRVNCKRTEDELKKHRGKLKELVDVRTGELAKAVSGLEDEVASHLHTEEELQETAGILESIFSTTHFLIAYLSTDFTFIKVNRAYAEAGGHPEEFYIGKLHFDLYPDEENEGIFRRVVETGEPYTARAKPFEYAEYPERGVTYWDWTLHPVKDAEGDIEGLVLIILDVTERIRAEEQLISSQASLSEAQRIAHLGSWDWNIETNELVWSDEIYRIFGLSPEEFGATYNAFLNAVHPDDRGFVEDSVNEAVYKREPYDIEHRIVRPGGEERIVHEMAELRFDKGSRPVRMIGTVQDVTEQRMAEEARRDAERLLEEQRAQAIQTDRLLSLGEMAAAIAHELNQPLQGVRGLAEHIIMSMNRDWELTGDEIVEKARLIVEQGERMSHVIEHTRTFAREAGGTEKSEVDVNQVIESSMGLIGAQLRSRGLLLKLELGEDLPKVMVNPYSLEQAVLNLVANARDALSGQKKTGKDPLVRIRTFMDGAGDKNLVKIEVTDQGPGIPGEIIDRVFEPFFTTKSPDEGTGLGLSIARSIMEEFGGSIDISSEPGGGTTVTLSLPEIKK